MKTIALPAERHAQLQRLADIDGMTIADLIADFVRTAIHDGRLAADLPGWIVERRGDRIAFEHPATGIAKRLSIKEALSLADRLDALAFPADKLRAYADLDIDLVVKRVGTSVRIADFVSDTGQSVARSIANDIAHLLRTAAAN